MNKKDNKGKKRIEKKSFDKKALFQELLPLIKSFILWIILVVIVAWDYTNKQWFSMIFVDFTTFLSYGLAKILFIPAKILGDGSGMVTTLVVNYKSIYINNYPMIIEIECSAYHAYLAVLSLVLFSKWNYKQKIVTGLILITSLAFINSLRIVMLGVVGRTFPQVFDVMHDYVWNILLVIVIWGLWEFANKKMNKINNNNAIS